MFYCLTDYFYHLCQGFELLTFHPAFLHSLGSQTPTVDGCLEVEQSEEKWATA